MHPSLSRRPPDDRPVIERVPLAAWWSVSVLLLFFILSMVDRTVITMMVDPIQKSLRLTDLQMSFILGPAFAVSYALGAFPFGWLVDRYSRRTIVAGGVALWSMSTLCSGLSMTFSGLFASRVGVGTGEAALSPAAYSLIGDTFPRARLTTALAVYGMGPKLGAGLAFALVAALLPLSHEISVSTFPLLGGLAGWQVCMILIGAPGLFLSLFAFSFSEPARHGLGMTIEGGVVERPRLIDFLKSRQSLLLPLLIGFACVGGANGALSSWAPTYLTRQFGWGPERYGPAMALIGLLSAWIVILKGLIVDWFYARGMTDAHLRIYVWLLMIAAPTLGVAFLANSAPYFLLFYGIANIVALSFMIYVGAIIQMIVPNELRGQLSALALFIITVFAGASPTLVGWMSDRLFPSPSGLGHALGIVGVSCLLMACILLTATLGLFRRTLMAMDGEEETVADAAPQAASPTVAGAGAELC